MGDFAFNIAKGRIAEFYQRVKSNDPANSAFIIVPIEATGIELDSVLVDKDDLAAVLSGATNEQTTMGRKTLTDADLAAIPAPDDTNDWNELSIPTVTWVMATGNPLAKILICFDFNTTSGSDSDIVPMIAFDAIVTPDGNDLDLTGGVFYRAV